MMVAIVPKGYDVVTQPEPLVWTEKFFSDEDGKPTQEIKDWLKTNKDRLGLSDDDCDYLLAEVVEEARENNSTAAGVDVTFAIGKGTASR